MLEQDAPTFEEAGIDIWIVANLFAMAMALVALGRLSEASDALNEAMGKPSNRSEVLLGIALVSAYIGDQRRAREYLADAESRFGKSPDRETRETFTRLKLTYAAELARFGIDVMPIEVVCRQLSRFVDGPVTPHIRLSLACAYGQAAAAHGDSGDVERASTLLGSFSTPVSGGELRPPILINRIRADLELAKPNRDAPLHRSSFRSEIDSAYPLEYRLLETQVSRLTIRDQVTPDRNEIRINVDGLQTWFEEHSAHGFRFLIDSARQELQARRGGRPLYPAGLTEREVEVLRLLSAGLTNRQIADRLTLSVHTVGQHVRNIYSRTGSSNRAQATAFARGEGLTESSQQLEQR